MTDLSSPHALEGEQVGTHPPATGSMGAAVPHAAKPNPMTRSPTVTSDNDQSFSPSRTMTDLNAQPAVAAKNTGEHLPAQITSAEVVTDASEPINNRPPGMTSEDDQPFGASRTMIDLNAPQAVKNEKTGEHLPTESTLGAVERQKEEKGEMPAKTGSTALSSLPPARKSFLLAVFCLAYFRKSSCVSLFSTLTDNQWILPVFPPRS